MASVIRPGVVMMRGRKQKNFDIIFDNID